MSDELEWLIKFVLAAVGIGGVVYSLYAILLTQAAKSWLPVPGTITSHSIDVERDSDGDYMYEAKVCYTYEYRGRSYKGKRIAFGFSSWNVKSFVQNAYIDSVARVPSVTIHVNPKNPKISTILCGIRSFHIANAVFFSVWNIIMYKVITSGSV